MESLLSILFPQRNPQKPPGIALVSHGASISYVSGSFFNVVPFLSNLEDPPSHPLTAAIEEIQAKICVLRIFAEISNAGIHPFSQSLYS